MVLTIPNPPPPPPLSETLSGLPVSNVVPPGHCQFQPDTFIAVPLLGKLVVSPTTTLFRFGLPNPKMPLNLTPCACLLARAKIKVPTMTPVDKNTKKDNADNTKEKDNDEFMTVCRPYTPISTNELIGCFDVLIKHYGPTAKLSRFIHEEIQIGDSKLGFSHSNNNVRYPIPRAIRILQHANNNNNNNNNCHIIMLAGGTGIAPMLQTLHAILSGSFSSSTDHHDENNQHGNHNFDGKEEKEETDDTTAPTAIDIPKVTLLYGCRCQEQILAYSMLNSWQDHFGPDKFQVKYVLSREPRRSSGWNGERGYIKASKILKHCRNSSSSSLSFKNNPYEISPPDSINQIDDDVNNHHSTITADILHKDNTIVLVCGPPRFYDSLCGPRDDPKVTGILANLGYTDQQVFKF